MLPSKSISFKLAVVLSGFIFVLLLILGAFIYTYMSYDMSLVDMAGRQRMLLQKFSKEFFLTEVVPIQVRNSALKTAEDINMQITRDRAEYTKAIMKIKAELDGVTIVKDWEHVEGAMPLPVTFIQEVSEKIKEEGRYNFDLISKWNINSEKGLKTRFEKEAFKALQVDKGMPYYEFLEHDEVFVLRYATADTASTNGCVSCHNALQSSTKKDFKLGDLIGILVTTIPITEDVALGKKAFSGEETAPGEETYTKTAKIFEETLRGFMYGGEVPLDLAMTKSKVISPIKDADTQKLLKEAERLWNVMLGEVETLKNSNINSSEYLNAIIDFEKTTDETLSVINEAVERISNAGNKWLSNMIVILCTLIIAAIGLGISGWVIISRMLLRPTKKMVSMAKALTGGDFTTGDLNITTDDEMGILGNALDSMKRSLNITIVKTQVTNDFLHYAMSGVSLKDTLQHVIEELTSLDIFSVETKGGIWLVDEPGVLHLTAQKGLASGIQNVCERIPFGKCLCGRAALFGRVEFSAAIDKRHEVGYEGMEEHGHYCLPIVDSGTVLGVINLYLKNGHPRNTEQEEFLQSIADISAGIIRRKQAEEALADSENKLQKISLSAHDAIIMIDDAGKITYCNPASMNIFGYTAGDFLGRDVLTLISSCGSHVTFQRTIEKLKDTRDSEQYSDTVELMALRKDSSIVPVEVSLTCTTIKGKMHIVAILRDITERKRSEKTIRQMAYFDQLTGLPNRNMLMDRLEQVLARERRLQHFAAILFFDLDRFKTINDTLGHSFGDELLKAVAERIITVIRTSDTAARLGGDEFVLLLDNIEEIHYVDTIALKILELFNNPFIIREDEIHINASMGISIFPEDGSDMETLIKKADIAMYRAKETGGSSYHIYSASMNENAKEKLKIENRLRRAVEKEELLLHYQPQVNAMTGQIVGGEALLRWESPEHGLVSPGEFIPLAEETGLIIPIGGWVFRAACLQNKMWRDMGFESIQTAVNISMRQFNEKHFLSSIERILEETGADPEDMELELTESIIMHDAEATLKVCDKLKGMGLRLSIDDFGTGYSSLEYLKRMPIDMLKIARPFVRDITVDSDDANICRTIITLAQNLGIEVIAEGVETVDQLKMLNSFGCDKIQGFLFSKPVTPDSFEELLGQRKISIPAA